MPNENAYFIIENVYNKHNVKQVKKEIDSLHGVTSVTVNPEHNLVCVDYDSSGTSYDQIENKLNKMGFEIAADTSKINTR